MFVILLLMDPGRKRKNLQDSFLVINLFDNLKKAFLLFFSFEIVIFKNKKLVENRIQIKEYCPTCVVKKASGTKHCLICDICVENFDHHCSWLNNCIGKRNLYIFWIFLVIVTINLMFNLAISIECKEN